MVYTRKHPALFIIGVVLLAIYFLATNGGLAGYIDHLGGSKYKYMGELTSLPLYFGILSVIVGAWQWFGSHREGNLDYYSSTSGATNQRTSMAISRISMPPAKVDE